MPKKLLITATNLLVYYLIIEVSYIELLVITKLMFIDIEFEIFREVSYTYDSSAKLEREIRLS